MPAKLIRMIITESLGTEPQLNTTDGELCSQFDEMNMLITKHSGIVLV